MPHTSGSAPSTLSQQPPAVTTWKLRQSAKAGISSAQGAVASVRQ
jgi:hypothetical protein